MAAAGMTGGFHNPFKSWSPLNKIFFAGEGICHSYDELGRPYAGRHQCLGETFTSKLIWTPDYHLAGRTNFARSVEKGTHEGCTCKLVEHRRRPIMFVQRDRGAKYVVIHTHGNGCDVGDMQPAAVEQAARWQAHVILPEYPGYGEAPGRSSVKDVEWAVMSAALFALSELKVPHERIIIFGYSIGSGAACMLARSLCEMDMPPACLMLHAGYTSLRNMAVHVAGAIGNATFNRFKTKKNLPYVTAPVLVLHGDRDEVIPFEMGVENFHSRDGLKYPTEFFRQVGCTHNEYNANAHVMMPGLQFLQKHVKGYNTASLLKLDSYPAIYDSPPGDIDTLHKNQKYSTKKMGAVAACMCGATMIEIVCGGVWLAWRGLKRNIINPMCPWVVKQYKLKIKKVAEPEFVKK